jgi:hypothetical protein
MRIGFDLDGVLADLHTPFVQTAIKLFPNLDARVVAAADIGASPPDEAHEPPADAPAPPSDVVLDREQTRAVWRVLMSTNDFWAGLQEIEPGAIARLAQLADARRWEIIFLTSRPKSAGRTVQRQSQQWLDRHGFPHPSLYVVHSSRGRIADALHLDVVVDDRPDNCLDVVLESKAGAVLVWRGPQSTVPSSARRLGIAVVSTVGACLDALVQAQESDAEGGIIDRLRRLFGLRTRSASPLRR